MAVQLLNLAFQGNLVSQSRVCILHGRNTAIISASDKALGVSLNELLGIHYNDSKTLRETDEFSLSH
jgi:hypothetical protein